VTNFNEIEDDNAARHPAFSAFKAEMFERDYGGEALNDAWSWFKKGWEALNEEWEPRDER